MLPPGHLAGGYLLYSAVCRVSYRAPPVGTAVVALAVGTQFPDVIDKPLAYWGGLFTGRSLSHSLLFAVPLCCGCLGAGLRHDRRREAVAFGIGYASHLGLDTYSYFLAGEFGKASFLLFPAYPAYDATAESFAFHLEHHVPSPRLVLQDPFALLLAAGVVGVWIYDGLPGLRTTWTVCKRAVESVRRRPRR